MSATITESPLPDAALLRRFMDSGDYTDCFMTRIDADVTFPDYVAAFYTTAVFKAERFVLRWLVCRPSTDDEAKMLASGGADTFAAWKVLDRTEDQLLLMDFRGQTCSWLMIVHEADGRLLYFGSAVISGRKTTSGRRRGWWHRALPGFHRLYSRLLLHAARARLLRQSQRNR